MSYDILEEEERGEKAGERKKAFSTAVIGGLACLALALLAFRFGPRITQAVSASVDPPLRSDIVHYILVDNSGSMVQWGLKHEASRESVQMSKSLGPKPVQTVVIRVGHDPVEIYRGTNTEGSLIKTFREHYEQTRADPQPGTYLAPVLEQILKETSSSPRTIVLITIAADSFDDTAAIRNAVLKLKARGNVLLIHHAVPVHDPRTALVQMQLREDARKALYALQTNVTIVGKTEFPGVITHWLPAKLRTLGWKP
jgi:hypothetical protein